jgi:tetratricopeptide (TPR) repeat protein
MDARKPAEAAAILDQLTLEWPDIARFRENLALCYLSLGRIPEAKKLLLDLLDKRPEEADARRDWMMGIILHQEGDKEGSLQYLLQAEQSNPQLPICTTCPVARIWQPKARFPLRRKDRVRS